MSKINYLDIFIAWSINIKEDQARFRSETRREYVEDLVNQLHSSGCSYDDACSLKNKVPPLVITKEGLLAKEAKHKNWKDDVIEEYLGFCIKIYRKEELDAIKDKVAENKHDNDNQTNWLALIPFSHPRSKTKVFKERDPLSIKLYFTDKNLSMSDKNYEYFVRGMVPGCKQLIKFLFIKYQTEPTKTMVKEIHNCKSKLFIEGWKHINKYPELYREFKDELDL